ncbi:hypothetical protein AB0K48_22330, partial [Nonomuraea sp. NPDC055795]
RWTPYSGVIVTSDSTDRNVIYSPLIAGATYRLWVRATNEGVKGVLSPAVTVTIPNDTVPPPVPSTSVAASQLGVIHVAWGQGQRGRADAGHFDRVRAYMRDPLNGADLGAHVGYLTGAGVEVIPGQPYNADREVWLTAADRLGSARLGSARQRVCLLCPRHGGHEAARGHRRDRRDHRRRDPHHRRHHPGRREDHR